MRVSRAGLAGMVLVVVWARAAASEDCREDELDERGECPRKPRPKQPPRLAPKPATPTAPPKPAAPPSKQPTQLDIQGEGITGAQVSLDGQPAGSAPLTLQTTPGRHLVEVKRDGYAPFAEWIEVKEGERRRILVKLQAAAPAPNPPVAAATPPSPGAATSVMPSPPPAPTAPPALPPGTCTAEMVKVPAGSFRMGSTGRISESDERPQHDVRLSAFCVDRTEVTVKAYEACVAAGGCAPVPPMVDPNGYVVGAVRLYVQSCNRADRPDHPINCVDWSQAAAYCQWAGKRLPTEAEWEYAARGADGRLYPWGNAPPTEARLNACGFECVAMWKRVLGLDWKALHAGGDGWVTTAPVGSYPAGASPFGALDMSGNVWEWTADWYGGYTGAPAIDPRGERTGSARVDRGGGWNERDPGALRAGYRNAVDPSFRGDSIGFRCAR